MTKRLPFDRVLAGLALFLVASGCIFNCNPGPPEPARCMGSTPSEATLDEIALFSASEIRGPLEDFDRTDVEVGGQGFTMATVRAGWRGGDMPECAKVKITISGTTTEGDLSSTPNFDWRVTDPIYHVIDDGTELISVELEIYGLTLSRTLRLVDEGYVDAGMDARAPDPDAGQRIDAGESEPDAGESEPDAGESEPDAGENADSGA